MLSNQLSVKLLVVLMLFLGATVTTAGGWSTVGLIGFGLFNTLVSPPGTLIVRQISVVAALGSLLGPDWLRVFTTIVIWLIWPPAFAVAWSLGSESHASEAEPPDDHAAGRRARLALAAVIAAVAIASIAFRLIVANRLQQTAALFIGIPAILAIVVVLVVSPRSAIGVACKAVTVGLLVSLVFLGEGHALRRHVGAALLSGGDSGRQRRPADARWTASR